MMEVQTRLHRLEAAVRRQEETLRVNDLLPPESNDNSASPSHESLRATYARNNQPLVNYASGLRSADIQETCPETASTDGMAITYISEEDSGYFGTCSDINKPQLMLTIHRPDVEYSLYAAYFPCNGPKWRPRRTDKPAKER